LYFLRSPFYFFLAMTFGLRKDQQPVAPSSIILLDEIRRRFPALARIQGGDPVAYFDGPGGTQVPRVVVEAMNDYLYYHNANTHWAYPTSEETDALIESARAAFAEFLNGDTAEIVFGANMTTLTFHLARALGRGYNRGDEIVVTELDHHANIAPWKALEKERGVTVRMAKMVPETGQLDWGDFVRQLGRRTKLVAIGAASNALGTINDVKRAAEMAHAIGARIFVDGVHYAPHELIDVQEWNCDFLACSAYKFYGPHIGILWGRRDLLNSLHFPKLIPAPDSAPERAETGTQNHEGIVGAAAAVNFVASLVPGLTRRESLRAVFTGLRERADKLLEQLWNNLQDMRRVCVYGSEPRAARTPTVAFTIRDVPSMDAAKRLAKRGLFLSHGDFYAATVVERLGHARDGLVRAGLACYNTSAEVDRLLEAISHL
jgi:cysteine desulfurase family protein (TIGR01976 family)